MTPDEQQRGASMGPSSNGRPGALGRGRTGVVLLIVGFALVLKQLGARGVLFELLWLGALFLGAAWTWRAVERRQARSSTSGRPNRIYLLIVAAFGMAAVITLDRLAGSAFLGSIALFFWLLFGSPRVERRRATGLAIVAGLFTTLAAVAGVEALWPRWDGGAIFFLGMTATFTFIYLLPRRSGGAPWALWPALVWAALTFFVNDPSGRVARWMVPLALIGLGVVLLGYTRGRRR